MIYGFLTKSRAQVCENSSRRGADNLKRPLRSGRRRLRIFDRGALRRFIKQDAIRHEQVESAKEEARGMWLAYNDAVCGFFL